MSSIRATHSHTLGVAMMNSLTSLRFRRAFWSMIASLFAAAVLLANFALGQDKMSPNLVVLATIPVGNAPVQVAVNQATNMVYVANFLSSDVTVIDGATNSTITVTDPNASGPYDVAVNPATNKIYVPNFDSGTVTVIDGNSNTTTTVRDPNAGCPAFAAVNLQTNMIYVTNWCSDNVTVINGANNSTTTVPVGVNPLYVAVNETTNMIYTANQGGSVTVIDGATNVSTTITDPNAIGPTSYLAVNQVTNKIYAANWGSSNVTVIDGATNAITTVKDPNAVHASVVAINEQTNTIYVTNGGSGPYVGSNNVTVINGATNKTTTVTDPNANGPSDVKVDTALNLIYVPNWGSNNITVINGATNATLTLTNPDAIEPNNAAINETTQRVYVANGGGYPFSGSNNVTVIGIKSTTNTALTSSLNPSTYGQKVTFTATVTNNGGPVPTGKVAFVWGIHNIGAATLNTNGVATLTLADLNADTYPLTAIYRGDSSNLGSTSPVLSQAVNQATSSATLKSSPNPSQAGESVTFTAHITSPTVTPKGPVTFTAGKTVLGTVSLNYNGRATLTTSSLPLGSNVVTVTFNGDSNISKSSASVTQVVEGSSLETSLAKHHATPGPGGCWSHTTIVGHSGVYVDDDFSFTAYVTVQSFGCGGETCPGAGTVVFYDDKTNIGTSGVDNACEASVDEVISRAGTHVIRAVFQPYSSSQPSYGTLSLAVPRYPTSTSLTSSLDPSTYGQPVTLTAIVTSLSTIEINNLPTGKVLFSGGTNHFGSATLVGNPTNGTGVATLTVKSLDAQTQNLTATYQGDSINGISVSPVLSQVVQQAVSSAALGSSVNPAAQGESVTFTVEVTSPTVTPRGPVTLSAGTTVLGTVSLDYNGRATLTTSSLPVGTTTVTAAFEGDSNIKGSSASVTQVVQ